MQNDLFEIKVGGKLFGTVMRTGGSKRLLGCQKKLKPREKIQKKFLIEEPISPEMRIGICLYRLPRGEYLYTIVETVGPAEATV